SGLRDAGKRDESYGDRAFADDQAERAALRQLQAAQVAERSVAGAVILLNSDERVAKALIGRRAIERLQRIAIERADDAVGIDAQFERAPIRLAFHARLESKTFGPRHLLIDRRLHARVAIQAVVERSKVALGIARQWLRLPLLLDDVVE